MFQVEMIFLFFSVQRGLSADFWRWFRESLMWNKFFLVFIINVSNRFLLFFFKIRFFFNDCERLFVWSEVCFFEGVTGSGEEVSTVFMSERRFVKILWGRYEVNGWRRLLCCSGSEKFLWRGIVVTFCEVTEDEV